MSNPGRRERKRQQTMNHLADVAWALFQTHGFEAVTMASIAETADVAKGTLYKHFPVKEALLRHRFHRELADHLPTTLSQLAELTDVAARMRGFLDLAADWAMRNRTLIGPYLHLRMSEAGVPYDLKSPNRSGIETVFSGFIGEGQHKGEFRDDVDATTAAQYLEFLYLAALMRWLNGSQENPRQEFHTMLDFFLRGMNR
jgi:AcrR family transcriptional regulator